MKKIFLLALIAFGIISNAEAQQENVDSLIQQVNVDSLKQELNKAKEDTNKVILYDSLANYYKWDYPDSAIKYGIPGLQLARELEIRSVELDILFNLSESFSSKGNYPKALEMALKSLPLAERSGDLFEMRSAIISIANVYFYSGEYQKALDWYRKLHLVILSINPESAGASNFLGETFFELGQLDSARYHLQKRFAREKQLKRMYKWPPAYFYLSKIYLKMGQYDSALWYSREGIAYSQVKQDSINGNIAIAEIFKKLNTDSAIHHAKQALLLSQETGIAARLSEASEMLAKLFVSVNKPDSAFKYFELGIIARDSLYNIARQNLSFNEQLNQRELAYEQQKAKNRIRMNSLFGALGTFLLILFFLWRNNRHKQKAKAKIEKAYDQLKSTQAQLIQSEKMASLGELTAGIAHEIQNPLNFVNNFSEVNRELIEELKGEKSKAKSERDEELEGQLLNNIEQNLEKINHHGKRADAIVKGMLQHSRKSSGQKEPTDINALCDEYLRLAYHGLRAKDKSFNAKLETDFDPAIEKINVVSQDIGRVILNLINNSFYSVTEKRKQLPVDYEPTVSIHTRKLPGKIEIRIKDNGNGIPPPIMEKMFQPFFTTKPTGQGTGLGLSLSYDIVTKGHNGLMKAESKEGEFAEFIIQLPK